MHVAATRTPAAYTTHPRAAAVVGYDGDPQTFVNEGLPYLFRYLRQPETDGVVLDSADMFGTAATVLQLVIEAATRNHKHVRFADVLSKNKSLQYAQLQQAAKQYVARRGFNEDYPNEFQVVTGLANCTIYCRMCIQAEVTYREKHVMSVETLKHVMEFIPRGRRTKVSITPFAEPLALSGFIDLVEAACTLRPDLDIAFNTNGVHLTEELARKFVEWKLGRIHFSLNVHTKEDYIWFAKKDYYDQVCENIRMMRRIRDEMGGSLPHIGTQIMQMPRNEPHYKAFFEEWSQVVDWVYLRPMRDQAGEVNIDNEVFEDGKLPDTPLSKEAMCASPWTGLAINWNGDIFACCATASRDYENTQFHLGNVKDKKDFQSVWNGEYLREIRRSQILGENDTCRKCSFYGTDDQVMFDEALNMRAHNI